MAQSCHFVTPWTVQSMEFFRPEWVAFPFSRRSSPPRDWTQVSRITGGLFTSWATREAKTLQKTWAYFCPWTLCLSWQGSGLKPSWLSEDPNENLWPTSYSSLGKLYHSSGNEHYQSGSSPCPATPSEEWRRKADVLLCGSVAVCVRSMGCENSDKDKQWVIESHLPCYSELPVKQVLMPFSSVFCAFFFLSALLKYNWQHFNVFRVSQCDEW